MTAGTIHTVGHSTRTLDEFIGMLRGHGVAVLADVRRFPGSRRHPWFNSGVLRAGLAAAGIDYEHFPDLGGRRKPLPRSESPNTGWRSEGFRGYADYMLTAAFAGALESLLELARRAPTAAMCAEAVPWRCHRSLLADALAARGWTVLHLTGAGATGARPHELHELARIDGSVITYPGAEETGFLFRSR